MASRGPKSRGGNFKLTHYPKVSDLRRQLEQTQEENDRLRHENEELRKELKAAGRGSRHLPHGRQSQDQRSEATVQALGFWAVQRS
jgi:regulator of replication initiation timing